VKVLVTGAAGFLGRHLSHQLLARGDAVVGLDLAFDPPPPPGVSAITASVTDAAALCRAAAGCDALIHAAALTGLWDRDPANFERVNLGGTEAALTAAAAAGVTRAVHVSSYVTLISGHRGDPPRTVDETLELAPEAMLGPYPRAKRLAELAALAAPIVPAIVLPSAPIGPGDHRPTPPGQMLEDLANGRIPAMIETLFDLVDVRAVAAGAIAALDRGRPGQRYLLSGETLTTAALLERVAAITGLRPPRARVPYGLALATARAEAAIAAATGRPPTAPVTGVRLAGPRIRFDNARARGELGFAPPPVETALRDALIWMQRAGRLRRPLPGLSE